MLRDLPCLFHKFTACLCIRLCVCLNCSGQCEYEDSIEFQGKEGSIQVRLLATIPCHALEVPDSVLLPLCAVQHSSRTTFRLKNARYIYLRVCPYTYVCVIKILCSFFFHVRSLLFINPLLRLFFSLRLTHSLCTLILPTVNSRHASSGCVQHRSS